MKFIFSGLALPATGAWCRIAQINKRTDLQIKLAAIERSKHRRVVALKFTIELSFTSSRRLVVRFIRSATLLREPPP